MQTCKRCLQEKPLDAFQFRKETGKYRGVCIACISADNLKRYRSKTSTRSAHWEAHVRNVLKKYGLTQEGYENLWEKQEGHCAICETPMERWGKRVGKGVNSTQAVIDHDHSTGKVRGLLCNLCNSGLGKFKDDPYTLRKAIIYLEDNNETTAP